MLVSYTPFASTASNSNWLGAGWQQIGTMRELRETWRKLCSYHVRAGHKIGTSHT